MVANQSPSRGSESANPAFFASAEIAGRSPSLPLFAMFEKA